MNDIGRLTLNQITELVRSLSETDKEKLLWFTRGMNAASENKLA